jgi:hypothetical protein
VHCHSEAILELYKSTSYCRPRKAVAKFTKIAWIHEGLTPKKVKAIFRGRDDITGTNIDRDKLILLPNSEFKEPQTSKVAKAIYLWNTHNKRWTSHIFNTS